MSTIKAKNIKQTVIGGTTQPLKIGGILEDGSDAKISIDTSGNTTLSQVIGIKFPATQNPSSDANTLDDYEEGTWTPSVGGNATYIHQYGIYTKIGRTLVISFDIAINQIGTGDTKKIINSPFVPLSLFSGNVSIGYFNSIQNSVVSLYARQDYNSNNIIFEGLTTASNYMSSINVFGNYSRVIGSVVINV